MPVEGRDERTKDKPVPVKWAQRIIAVLVGLLVIGYTIGVLSGFIPEDRKIDAIHLALLALAIVVVAVLLGADVFERLKLLELTGFRLEMIERVKERQERQENQLEEISLILPLVFPETERKHLLNLDQGKTARYKGSHPLRAELRRLRSLKLIKMRAGHHVSEMKDDLNSFDLSDYVELTKFGERWVKRISEMEKTGPADVD